ncbi:universal stress protein [Paraburkholderia sp. G-4-1-8]|uniref:Universal stress protein n=2 Tax=Paraburkholderia antibiotica TaxID=2728839 RepID=A0A7X9X4B6_9BURK|nr:universal stress protein [Paraburkholderia antibiotica]
MNPAIDPTPFMRVMVASTGRTGLVPATHFSRQFAAADAKFRLVDIVCNPAQLFPTLILNYPDWCEAHRAMLHGAQASLRDTASALRQVLGEADTEVIDLTALHQGAAEALAHAARQWRADLIAVAAHRYEHRRAGRIDSDELVALTHCPVLYLPATSLEAVSPTVRRVLVAIDGSGTALDSLRVALAVAPPDARFKAVYAADDGLAWREWLPSEMVSRHRIEVLQRGEAMLASSRHPAEAALLDFDDDSGDTSSAILDEAQRWRADLIAMGSHGMRGAAQPFPGHVASRTLRDACCPVLVCPRGAASGGRARAESAWPQPEPGNGNVPCYS